MVYDQIVGSWGAGFTLSGMDGTEENFNGSGLMTSTLDNDGNSTTYNWSGSELTSIVDPSHHTTSFGYTSGLLTSITDFASRVTTLGYTSGQLTSVTPPNPNVSGETTPVTQLRVHLGKIDLGYRSRRQQNAVLYDSTAGGLAKMTNPDSSAEYYQAAADAPAGQRRDRPDDDGRRHRYRYRRAGQPDLLHVRQFWQPADRDQRPGPTMAYQYNGAEQVVKMQQPDPATGQIDAASPTTYYGYNPDYGNHLRAVARRRHRKLDLRQLLDPRRRLR